MKQYRALFQNRNFVLLWSGRIISSIGDWFNYVALIKILSADPAHLGFMLALVMVLKVLPDVLLAPLVGVLADRLPRRWIMIASDITRAGLVLGLVFAQSPVTILVLVCLSACMATFFNPANSALLPSVVGPDHLVTANALNTITGRTAQFLGNGLGAMTLLLIGAHNTFLIDSVSFLVSAALTALVAVPAVAAAAPAATRPRGALAKFRADLKEAVAYLRQQPTVKALITMSAIVAVGDAATNVLLITFVTVTLGLPAEWMGIAIGAVGATGVLGGLAVGAIGNRVHWRHLLNWGLIYVWAVFVGGVSIQRLLPSLGFFLLMGLGSGVLNVGFQSGIGLLVPNEVRGRIFGAWGMVQSAIYLICVPLSGFLSDRFGAVPVLLTFTITYLLGGVYGLFALRPEKQQEAAAAQPEPATD
ncbi:MAG: MFS transporter [Mycobacterium leprae]